MITYYKTLEGIYLEELPDSSLIKIKEIVQGKTIKEVYCSIFSEEGLKLGSNVLPPESNYYEIGQCKLFIYKCNKEYTVCNAFLNDSAMFLIDNKPTSFYSTIYKFIQGELKEWKENYLVYKYLPDELKEEDVGLYVDKEKIFDLPEGWEVIVKKDRWGINTYPNTYFPYFSYSNLIRKLIHLQIERRALLSRTITSIVHNFHEGLHPHPVNSRQYIDYCRDLN
jgi:hypothetical protein